MCAFFPSLFLNNPKRNGKIDFISKTWHTKRVCVCVNFADNSSLVLSEVFAFMRNLTLYEDNYTPSTIQNSFTYSYTFICVVQCRIHCQVIWIDITWEMHVYTVYIPYLINKIDSPTTPLFDFHQSQPINLLPIYNIERETHTMMIIERFIWGCHFGNHSHSRFIKVDGNAFRYTLAR